MFRVPVIVQGSYIEAVIDTASEITQISDQFYRSLGSSPPVVKQLTLYNAGRDMKMRGDHLGQLGMVVQGKKFEVAVTVAPIEDDMLLGLDFLSTSTSGDH